MFVYWLNRNKRSFEEGGESVKLSFQGVGEQTTLLWETRETT